MRRAHALALVAVLALAGCPASSQDGGTVTPAPVPTLSTPGEAQPGLPCDVPTAVPPTPGEPPTPVATSTLTPTEGPTPATANPTATETTSPTASTTGTPTAEPTPVPSEGEAVNVTALVDRHDRVLREYRYELRTSDLFVQSAPGEPALRVRARSSFSAIRHYVVNGTRYSYSFRYGGQGRYSVVPYDAETFRRGFGSSYSLTGSDWLGDALSVGTYRVAVREEDGLVILEGQLPSETGDSGTPATTDRTQTPDDGSIRSLNATVVVDARGIVRFVDQEYVVLEEEGERRTVERTFEVNDVGSADVERPEWVCIAERNGYLEVP